MTKWIVTLACLLATPCFATDLRLVVIMDDKHKGRLVEGLDDYLELYYRILDFDETPHKITPLPSDLVIRTSPSSLAPIGPHDAELAVDYGTGNEYRLSGGSWLTGVQWTMPAGATHAWTRTYIIPDGSTGEGWERVAISISVVSGPATTGGPVRLYNLWEYGEGDDNFSIDAGDLTQLSRDQYVGRSPSWRPQDADDDGTTELSDLESIVADVFDTSMGDANLDGIVGDADLAILNANWYGTGKGWDEADFNGDQTVTAIDLNYIGTNWNEPESVQRRPETPEPKPEARECKVRCRKVWFPRLRRILRRW